MCLRQPFPGNGSEQCSFLSHSRSHRLVTAPEVTYCSKCLTSRLTPILHPSPEDSSWRQIRSHVITDGQSVGLLWFQTPIWVTWLQFYYCWTVAVFISAHSLWDWDEFVVYKCCWPSPAPALLFYDRSSTGIMIIFPVSDSRLPQHGGPFDRIYVSKEQRSRAGMTILFVSSDLKRYSGRIRNHVHTAMLTLSQNPSCITTDG
jgi:hypothetical protein